MLSLEWDFHMALVDIGQEEQTPKVRQFITKEGLAAFRMPDKSYSVLGETLGGRTRSNGLPCRAPTTRAPTESARAGTCMLDVM